MIYVKDDKRYTQGKLDNMGITSPLDYGFEYLIKSEPEYDRLTEKLLDVGTQDGKVTYEVVKLSEEELAEITKQLNAPIIAEIEEIEAKKLPRAMADAFKGNTEYLTQYTGKVEALRATLK